MSYHNLIYQKENHVALLRLICSASDQGEMLLFANELSDACAEIQSDKDIRVIVLIGDGDKGFSFGGEDCLSLLSLSNPVASLKQPVMSCIKGDALGLGLELVLSCDLRICSETSHFAFPHIRRGVIPWDGGTQRLARWVGKGKALEMILTGETMDATEAFRIGLVNRILPGHEIENQVLDMARQMALKSPISLAYAKEAICKGMDLTLDQGLRLEADLYFLIHTTGDRQEGIKAFQEKRTAHFEGK